MLEYASEYNCRSVKKILIANRGEIAVRIIRACREMGISPVAVYSECDRTALHVRYADEAYPIGPSAAARQLSAHRARFSTRRGAAGADAVHPGYGFLAENEEFAAAVRDAGLTFIGPTPEAIALMGNKTAARSGRGAPACPSCPGPRSRWRRRSPTPSWRWLRSDDRLSAARESGRRRRRQGHADGHRPARPRRRRRAARSEAGAAFGDAAVYLERRLVRPRHVEVQLLGDEHGTVVPFVERECSIQRRHQKVVEETPSLAVDAGAARGDDVGGGGRRARRRLHQRRHDRIPARRGRAASISSR